MKKNKLFKNRRSIPFDEKVSIIEPKRGWQLINLKELWEYRDLFFFLVWRDIKVLYAQTILGFSWAILQPFIQIVIYTVVFGKVAKLPTEGFPYLLFSSVAIIPWTYMSQAMGQSSQSLVKEKNMLGKVYFPRLIFPITPVLARLVDFTISLLIIFIVLVYYQILPTWNFLALPIFLLMMICIPAAVGLWLGALAIRFRDVRHAMPFALRMLVYSAPIVYSAVSIPDTYRFIYSLNPIVGVIEGFRSCLLGTPIPWIFIWPGIVTTLILLFTGTLYFKRMERIFADVI
jgi:lipopolysaccharide transport system permease protein